MITVKDFEQRLFDGKKFAEDLVEKKLAELLQCREYFHNKLSFIVKYWKDEYKSDDWLDFKDLIIKELESRGFVDVSSIINENYAFFRFNIKSEENIYDD